MNILLEALQNFQRDRALPRNHLGIIVGMHKGHAVLLRIIRRVQVGIIIGITRQLDARTIVPDRLDLDLRCGTRHDNQRLHPELACRQGDALRVVTGRCRHHTVRRFFLRQS